MTSTWRQLLPQFVMMMLIYFVIVIALEALFGIGNFVSRIIVALVVAFGYPAALRRMGREPPAWER